MHVPGRIRNGGIVALALALGACVPEGMRGAELVALEEAEQRQLPYAVYEMTEAGGHAANVVSWDSRNWMAGSMTESVPARLMQPIGEAGGAQVFAPTWSRAPHSRVYTRSADGRWHPLFEVP